MSIWIIVIGALLGGLAYGLSRLLEGATFSEYADKCGPGLRRMGWFGATLGMLGVLLIALLGSSVGSAWAKGELLTYNEFWNGYETEAIHEIQPCSRDGYCRQEYNCDPYEVTVAHTSTDSKGNTTTYYTTETHYHSCPYATEEWTFTIKTSLKSTYTIVDSGFPDNPTEWRAGEGIPSNVHRGVPAFWAEAKARIDSGNPGPVTEVKQYDNYILASQNTILKEYSDDLESFEKSGLIPRIATAQTGSNISPPYLGQKAYFVQQVPNQDQWIAAVNRFDSALGTELQGDMHLVFVDHTIDPASYKGALNAAWTGPGFERNALSKNGLVIIVGVDGNEGRWVRAFTGMPLGNEHLIAELEGLKDIPLDDPAEILGTPRGIINEERKVKEVDQTDGLIEDVVWGENRFQRVCMACQGPEDAGSGFVYLDAQIEPTGGQVAAVVALASLLSAMVWVAVVATQLRSPNLGTNKKGDSK